MFLCSCRNILLYRLTRTKWYFSSVPPYWPQYQGCSCKVQWSHTCTSAQTYHKVIDTILRLLQVHLCYTHILCVTIKLSNYFCLKSPIGDLRPWVWLSFVCFCFSFKTTRTAWPGKAFVLYTLYSLYTVQLYSTNMLQECTDLSRKYIITPPKLLSVLLPMMLPPQWRLPWTRQALRLR